MKTTYVNDINYLVKCLHWNYGVGDIKEIRRYANGKVEVESEAYGMKPHVRRGRIVSNPKRGSFTVKLYGHQLTGVVVGESK